MRKISRAIVLALLLTIVSGVVVSCQNQDHVVKTPVPPEPKK